MSMEEKELAIVVVEMSGCGLGKCHKLTRWWSSADILSFKYPYIYLYLFAITALPLFKHALGFSNKKPA